MIGVGLFSRRSSMNTNCSRRWDGWRKKDLLLSWTDTEGTEDVSWGAPNTSGRMQKEGRALGALAGSRLEGEQPS